MAATSSIMDGGLNIYGYNSGTGITHSVTIPGYTTASYAGQTASLLQDSGLNIFGYNANGVIFIKGLTTSPLGTTGPSASIVDSGLNKFGSYDPVNQITSIPLL